MSGLKNKAIAKAIRRLDVLGCEYMVVTPQGETFQKGAFERYRSTKRGELAAYVDPYLKDMKPGDMVMVPMGGFPVRQISTAVSSRAHAKFGRGNYVSHRDGDHVSLLCLDVDPATNAEPSLFDTDTNEGEE